MGEKEAALILRRGSGLCKRGWPRGLSPPSARVTVVLGMAEVTSSTCWHPCLSGLGLHWASRRQKGDEASPWAVCRLRGWATFLHCANRGIRMPLPC